MRGVGSVAQSIQSGRNGGTVWGFPLEGFSLFQGLLLTFAAALFTFCAATCISIFALLAWNLLGSHSVNFADTYRYVGLPASLVVLAVALPYFFILWIRAKVRQ
jgi:ABC-type nickel/cobalt efflux system permease component RcnA